MKVAAPITLAPASRLTELTDTKWDVTVIGAGVAGGLAAGLCARAGGKSLLIEKEPWPRSKVCGCCLNERGIAVLRRCGVLSYLPSDDCVALKQMDLIGKHSRATIVLPGGLVISRSGLDRAIAAWAQDQGAFFLPETLARPQAGSDSECSGIVLESRKESLAIKSRFVVGAWGLGGHASKWDAALTATIQSQSHMGAGTILSRDTDCSLPMGKLLMAVGKTGYAGVVRLGDGSLDVAAALDARQVRRAGGPGPLVRGLLEKIDRPLAQACAVASWKGTPPLTRRSGKISSGRIFLVGDAIGYVEPFTGEGMTWGLVGAEALAQVLSPTLKLPDSSKTTDRSDPHPRETKDDAGIERLTQTWEALYRKRIEQRQRACRSVSAALRFPLLTELGIASLRRLPSMGTWLARWLARSGGE